MAKKQELKVGDVVRLNSGSPNLTITRIVGEGIAAIQDAFVS